MSTPGDILTKIVRMSYAFFASTPCTPESIDEFFGFVGPMLEKSGVSKEELYSKLERLHNVTILDTASVLEDRGDHVEWFNLSQNDCLTRDIDWHFWPHYREYLTSGKNWPRGVVEDIDTESSLILSRLEDPTREGHWDRRGMVMGSVQSGKTANYMALSAKAIDAGYRLIVVLAGVHNSLRSQTQYRINEELLGYDLDKVQEYRGQAAAIGVRAMFQDHRVIQTLTSSAENGDFKKTVADQAGMIPAKDGTPIIMVVKKHVSILKNLRDWATAIIGQEDDSGRRVVTDVPLLLIDDECDYATVDTSKRVMDEDGNVDPECDPTRTNQRIRELLVSFRKSAYVGYTATPFANIFIHHKAQHPKYGADVFPRNFIISLPEPTNYIGPGRVFGIAANRNAGIDEQEGLPLVRPIIDAAALIPDRHKKDLVVTDLPESLKTAVGVFLLSCTARMCRESRPAHNSMLIHVTRFTDVQRQVHELVEEVLRHYVDRIRSGSDPLEDLKALWLEEMLPVSEEMAPEFGCSVHAWDDIRDCIYRVARRVKVKSINGQAKDTLDYRLAELEAKRRRAEGESVPWEESGEHVIAIGGDKLSRGLTLDGLTVSYYLRASKMYDTLMQMGRWFGYRDGYEDLCRIYTTTELADWYRFIASAALELKAELEYMHLINEEPRRFGLKVRSHPGQLAITSAGKRRDSERVSLSYSGRISETVVFDQEKSGHNISAVAAMMKRVADDPQVQCENNDPSKGTLRWAKVGVDPVLEFLRAYRTQDAAARIVNPDRIAEFIEKQQATGTGDLSEWYVAVVSRKLNPPRTIDIGDWKGIGCVERTAAELFPHLSIGRLVDPSDELIDFSDDERIRARMKWLEMRARKGLPDPEPSAIPSGPAIRAARPEKRGLLLVYLICSSDKSKGYGSQDKQDPVPAFAASFPSSNSTLEVEYEVNTVHQDAEGQL